MPLPSERDASAPWALISEVAHELRSPVAALVAAASSLDVYVRDLPVEGKRVVELALSDLERLRRLVEDLIDMAELELGDTRVFPEPTDLQRFVASLIAANSWDVRVDIRSEQLLEVDRRRLRKILTALLENAHARRPEDIIVSVTSSEGRVAITISDTGPPIPETLLERAFDRWPEVSPPAQRGTGLGLALARRHAEVLGAELTVVSHEERTSYTLSLPRP